MPTRPSTCPTAFGSSAERGGSTNTELTARRNPQGVTARERGVPWAHIEYARSVREPDDQVRAVQEATLSVLAAS